MVDQYDLIYYFNEDNFTDNFEDIFSWEDEVPNITVSTLPLKDVKARYFIENDCLNLAKTFLVGQKDHNPFLGFHDMMLSDLYWKTGDIDSSYIYAKNAFEALPNNEYHSAYFLERALKNEKFKEAELAFNKVKKRYRWPDWYLFLYGAIDSEHYESRYIDSLMRFAFKKFSYNEYLSVNFKIYKYQDTVLIANELEERALKYYNKKDYSQALEIYDKASILIPEEYTYYENAARCLLGLEKYQDALNKISIIEKDTLIKHPKNGKFNFYKALALLKLKRNVSACEELSISIKRGNKEAKELKNKLCI